MAYIAVGINLLVNYIHVCFNTTTRIPFNSDGILKFQTNSLNDQNELLIIGTSMSNNSEFLLALMFKLLTPVKPTASRLVNDSPFMVASPFINKAYTR